MFFLFIFFLANFLFIFHIEKVQTIYVVSISWLWDFHGLRFKWHTDQKKKRLKWHDKSTHLRLNICLWINIVLAKGVWECDPLNYYYMTQEHINLYPLANRNDGQWNRYTKPPHNTTTNIIGYCLRNVRQPWVICVCSICPIKYWNNVAFFANL